MSVVTEELARLRGHRWQISCLEFSPDGGRLASGSWDKEVRVWDLTTLETRSCLKDGHNRPVTSLSWYRPDGALIATGSADFTVGLWNSETGENLLTMREHYGWVLGSSFSRDGRFLATGSWDKTVRLWDPASGTLLNTLNGHTKGVWSVDFYPVGSSSMLCSGSEDGTVRTWDARTNKPTDCHKGGHKDAIYCVRWSIDGNYIASSSRDTKVAIWDTRTGQVVNFIHGHTDTVKSVAFSTPTASFPASLLASCGDCSVRISDPRPNQRTDVTCLSPHLTGKEVECVAVSSDSTLLATGGRDNTVVLTTMYMSTTPAAAASTDKSFSSSQLGSVAAVPNIIASQESVPNRSKSKEVNFKETPASVNDKDEEEEELLPAPDEVLLRSGSVINRDAHRRHSRLRKKGSVEEQSALQEQLASEVSKQKQQKASTGRHPAQELAGLRSMEEGGSRSQSQSSPDQLSPISSEFELALSDSRPVSMASSNFYNAVIKPSSSSQGHDSTVVITLDDNTDTEDEYDDEGPVSNI